MSEERGRKGARQQELGAEMDAVCERCGTVNPEETLLCKNCGNNLRDQRARRMASAQVYDNLEPTRTKTRWLTGLLPFLGLLLIVWTAMNVGRIENWLVSTQTTTSLSGQEFFEGTEASAFDVLAAELDRNSVTQDQTNLAMAQPSNPDAFEGRYAIMRKSLGRNELCGEALVAKKGDGYIFAAQLDNGMEVRGEAHMDANGKAQAENVGARYQGEYASGAGAAQRSEGLGYAIYGMLDLGETGYEATAYAIPDKVK